MSDAEMQQVADRLEAEGRLTYRTLGAEIRAAGAAVDNNVLKRLYRKARSRDAGDSVGGNTPAEGAEAPLLPAPVRDAMNRLETAIGTQLQTVLSAERARVSEDVERLTRDHCDALRRMEEEAESLLEDLGRATEELAEARQLLQREREEVLSLKGSLAESEQARTREAERQRTEVAALSERLREEAREHRTAETAVERARGETAAVTADRDAARQRLGDLERRLQEERDARARAEGERDAARQQAEVMRESALELRARLEATEEIQRQLQATLERLGRQGRGAKA